MYETQKTEQDNTSPVAALPTLNAPVLSTAFEVSQWSIRGAGSTMMTLLDHE
jgi:hypothetical protein